MKRNFTTRLPIALLTVLLVMLALCAVACSEQTEAQSTSADTTLRSEASKATAETTVSTTVPLDTTAVTTTKAPVTTAQPETTTVSVTTTAPVTTTVPITSAPPVTLSPMGESKIEKAVVSAAEKYSAVGVQVAVIEQGEVGSAYSYGWAEIDQRPMTNDTKIRVASLSKTVIAMVTFRLVEEGRLDLDADISDYIGTEVRNPAYPDDPITLRMLLSHTSGLENAGYVDSLAKLQQKLQKSSTYTKYKPGEQYDYNNFGFGVIGAICETVTGKPMNTLAKDYFFRQMGIDATFAPAELDSSEKAVLYETDRTVEMDIDRQLAIGIPSAPVEHMAHYAGGLYISATDYAKLLTLLVNDGMYGGERYLSKESIAEIESVQCDRPKGGEQCLPVWKCENLYGETTLFFHTGSNYGVYALYSYNPESGRGAVVVTTGAELSYHPNRIYAVCGEITEAVYDSLREGEGGTLTDVGIVYQGDDRVVAIDAGHQDDPMRDKEPLGPGSDELKAKVSSGAQGVSTRIPEYELNLAVALLLRDELIARGYTVVMIRESHDVTLSNIDRTTIANQAGADVFVRIHANGSSNQNKQGAYTICQTPDNPYNGELHDESYRLSETLLDGFIAQTGRKPLEIWETDTMTGINWAQMPVTIIEMGYLSNAEEDQLMATDEFRRNAAIGMANGLDAYFAE